MTHDLRIGLVEHDAYSGRMGHGYAFDGFGPAAHTLCGRRMFAGTSRGNVWYDHGDLLPETAARVVNCPDCQIVLRRLGLASTSQS